MMVSIKDWKKVYEDLITGLNVNDGNDEPNDCFVVFHIESPTKKDPERVLTFQADVQYLGDDYV